MQSRHPRLATLSALVLLLGAVSAEAQITLRPNAKADNAKVDSASRILVAAPFREGQDLSAAVRVCNGLRDQLSTRTDVKYTVISRSLMNAALKLAGYKEDEVLPEPVLSSLAAQMKAGIVILTVLDQTGDGRYIAKTEVRGLKAPVEVSLTQVKGESLEELGASLADQVRSRM